MPVPNTYFSAENQALEYLSVHVVDFPCAALRGGILLGHYSYHFYVKWFPPLMTGAVANLRGCGREAAAVLFWVHIFAIFSMAGWFILYFRILF